MKSQPMVSVVIPTRSRPDLLARAIDSVLAQTWHEFEILVVVDGPDAATEQRLAAAYPRVRAIVLPENVGLAEARNQGVRHAQGRWVAFLDDDDEWLPAKLEAQVARALELGGDYVFVPCRFVERTLTLERIMPKSFPRSGQDISDYLYFEGGYLQPSMYFASRSLLLERPFTRGLRHIEDTDWLLRALRHPQAQVGAVEEPLSIYYNYKVGTRESETTPWRFTLEWAIENHHLFTRRAFPYFVGRFCLSARRSGERFSTFLMLLRVAGRYGTLTPRVAAHFAAYWFLSDGTLKSMREKINALTGSPRGAAAR